METIYYTHDYPNDTTYTFTQDPDGRGQIEMTYTSEDPDYGTETLVYGGNAREWELRSELLCDIVHTLDWQEGIREGLPPDPYYTDNFCIPSLIAFNNMLEWMEEQEVMKTFESQLAAYLGISY